MAENMTDRESAWQRDLYKDMSLDDFYRSVKEHRAKRIEAQGASH
ncbi:hypothetical protein FACS1894190_13510 [Spirochaetia bacterium]|nr:hypothetical protein FACS1894190_13510 [Spirochaetia bacterium]